MTEPASPVSLHEEDAAGRRLANSEFVRPVVLQAGAGTGKTTALVARILVFALGPGWERSERALRDASDRPPGDERIAARVLRRIVAITFTDAAAAEMARRAGEAFLEVAAGGLPTGVEEAELPATEARRRTRARALAGALDRLVVRTIHAFARRLLAAHPVEAGLHPGFEVDGEGLATAAVVREVFELHLREAYGDPGDPVLLRLAVRGEPMAALEEALLALVQAGTDAAWLEQDPFSEAALAALAGELERDLEALCRAAGPLATLKGVPASLDALVRAGDASSRLRQRAPGSGEAGMAALRELVGETIGLRAGRLAEWRKGKFGKREEAALGEQGERALSAAAASLHRRVAWLEELDPERLDLARRALAPLLRRVRQILAQRGLVSYDDLLRDAARLLRDSPAVRERERAGIDQLLVDEFQDTDGLQCELVAALALGGEGERPGLFLVGDPKQAIYGWRGAELRAYDGFLARVREAGGCFGRLTLNHRSVQPILDEVARVIRPAMREQPGVQPRFEHLASARSPEAGAAFADGGCRAVEYWVSWQLPTPPRGTKKPAATSLEAKAVAADMARLIGQHGVEARRIALLLRGFGDVEEYLSALRDAGVPYAVARDRSYYRRREIADASALVRCVLDPSDELALLALLRSSLAGVPDAALLPLWRAELPGRLARLEPGDAAGWKGLREAVAEALQQVPADLPGLDALRGYEAGVDYLVRCVGLLRSSFARDPSDRFVERLRSVLLLEVGEASRMAGAFRHANLERFFRDLDGLLAHGASPSEVVRWLRQSARDERDAEEARPLEAAEQAVQVMSIHKAKGLTFDHVYVVQLHKASGGRGDAAAPARALPVEGDIALCLLGERSGAFLRVEERAAETEAAEHVRTLYVAMTRARDRLVLAGRWPEEDSEKRDARTHVSLLQDRESGVPDLGALAAAAGAGTAESHCVAWRFPARFEAARAATPAADAGAASRTARAEADARRLGPLRREALQHQARPFGAAVTASSHEAFRDHAEQARDAEDPPAVGAAKAPFDAVAGRIGTALHRALETVDATLDEEALCAALLASAQSALAADLSGDALERAQERVADLVARFERGGLAQRLRAVAPRVVARELPVLLPPDEAGDGPVGYLAGAVDLVYRDDDGGFVVADYKTDRVETDEEIERAAARHAAQGARYVAAVRQALQLAEAPRFELWFLHAGRIELAPPEA